MLPSFEILRTVAEAYGVSVDDLEGERRMRNVVEARQLAAYFLLKINDLSYVAIGKMIGRDHTTAIHSYNKVSRRIETRPDFKAFVEKILGSFGDAGITLNLDQAKILTSDEIKYLNKSLSHALRNKKKISYGFETSEDILKANKSTEMTERETEILSKYRRGIILEEIASMTGVTRERIRQIIMHALIKELGQKAEGGFKIDVREYIDSQKSLHNRSRNLPKDQQNEILKKIAEGTSLEEIFKSNNISKEKFFKYFPQYQERFEIESIKKKKWSKFYTKCRNCGTTAIPHQSHGLCEKCYPKSDYFKELVKTSYERNREKRKEHFRIYSKEYLKRPEVITKMKRAWDLKYYGGNREKAIENSGFRCARCGMSREAATKKFGKELFVHHIDKDKNNNVLSNLEALCYDCFKKIPKT
jgi:DNA-binding CsgD family transcriptional regulator